MNSFRFASPEYGLLLWLVAALGALLVWLDQRGGTLLARFVSTAMAKRLVVQHGLLRRLSRIGLLTAAGVFLVLALMRPQWGMRFVQTPRMGAEIMVALDVSRSMLAEDVAPNRLERAKAELRDLLPYLKGDKVGLIAFAGRASVISPLTPDFGFLRLVLDSTGPNSVSRGGTDLAEPIRKAVDGFGAQGDLSRTLLLITDGEDHDEFAIEAAKAAAERGVRILAIGFGDEAGSDIQITDQRTGVAKPLRDADGNVVISKLNGSLLRELARETGGAYVPAGTGVLDLESIYSRHIAPLVRGRLDGESRSVRDEGFQWPLLAALVSLLGAAFIGTRGSAFAVVALVVLSLPASATAQEERATRSAYNTGLEKLTTGELDLAESAFAEARENARNDGELRYRATYNLAWVDVRRADAAIETDPAAALQALEHAADWFRRAVQLRPEAEAARKNLEVVLYRAMVLADAIAEREESDLTQAIVALIEAQRELSAAAAGVLEAGIDDPALLRPPLRELAGKQLELDAQADAAVTKAAREFDAIQARDEGERTPEDAARAVQLAGSIHYLHRARERVGQARSAMRRLDAERAFRRGAAALEELKRARDQLLDPVTVLDALVAEALTQARSASLLAAAQARVSEVEAPTWLTTEFLAERQDTQSERIGELAAGFDAVLEQGAAAHEAGTELDEDALSLLARVGEATPLVSEARDASVHAHTILQGAAVREALPSLQLVLQSLAGARERFLDLRRLVELLHSEQLRIAPAMAPDDTDQVGEYAPLAAELQRRNLERTDRVSRSIRDAERALERPAGAAAATGAQAQPNEEQTAAERARLQAAAPLLDAAAARMQETAAMLEGFAQAAELDEVRASMASAELATAELRRLFFSVVEHLKEIAGLQQDLNDRSGALATLAAHAMTGEIAVASGRLAPEQQTLGERSRAVAAALAEHAMSLRQAPPAAQAGSAGAGGQGGPGGPGGPPGGESPEQAAERFDEAAAYVDAAAADMGRAVNGLTIDPPQMSELREYQDVALENILSAIELLEPPKPPEGQDGDQEEDQQDGEQGEPQEQPEQNSDPSAQLQGVREREAERRSEHERAAERRYTPVEKDW